ASHPAQDVTGLVRPIRACDYVLGSDSGRGARDQELSSFEPSAVAVTIAGIPSAMVANAMARASIMSIPLRIEHLPRAGETVETNVYRALTSGVFRPKGFWFRGLWQKSGERFAFCGGNRA